MLTKQAKIDIWKFSPENHILFYKVSCDKKHSKPPRQNICGRNSLRPPPPAPGTHFFPDSPLFKIWDRSLSTSRNTGWGGGWYCDILPTVTEKRFLVWNYSFSGPTNIYLLEFSSRIKCQMCSKLTIKAPVIVWCLHCQLGKYLTCYFKGFFAGFEHVNVIWNTLRP